MYASWTRVGIACLAWAVPVMACGPWLPPRWLEKGGAMLAATPEFYWEMEVRQIAAERPRPIWPWTAYDSSKATARLQLADEMDYQAAIKKGSVSADGQARHLERREQLSSLSPSSPALVFSPSDADEFAMYQRGAEDFKRGNKRWSAAEKHWTSLLALPHNQRTFRSTWAAYMLGRLKLLQAEFPQAAQWFQKTRELADTGCIDSLHLAADSLGWEAHCRWKGGELSQAARLYLDQLACGDDTAVTSLRQILRNPNSETTVPTNQHWMDTAKDSVLRRLTTASILSSYSPLWMDRGETVGSIHQWLTIVRQAKLQQVEDAAQLGWLAYTAGDYEAATQWLQLNATPSAASHWLKAKLLRREGRLDQAAEHLSQAIHLLDGAPALTLTSLNPDMTLPGDAARADLAALHLERAEFVGALTAFLEAGKNQDAAYVAERILTPDELRAYVDDHFTLAEAEKSADAPESVDPWDEMSSTLRWRWLLGRRLMRARRYQEALPYLPSTVRSKAQSYQQALEQAQDPSRPRVERARSWFEAAWRVRHHGFEMMATEVEPDAFCWSGSFEISSIATDRARGYWQPWSWKSEAPPKPQPLVTRVTSDERSRLEWSHLRHEKRFQYRYLAADHAWQASRLLPAQSEELADVLNTAGSWLKVRDPSAADRFYQALESRAGKTALGEQVTARHWFVEQTGPWSTALQHLQ